MKQSTKGGAPMGRFNAQLEVEKQQRRDAHLWRQPKLHNAERAVNFCSNDYLSLSKHPRVVQRFQQALAEYGTGSGGSPLVSGYQKPHRKLEEQLADWLGVPAVALTGSGYAANHAVVAVLAQHKVGVLYDKRNHASMYDAVNSCRAQMERFRHQDLAHALQQSEKLKRHTAIQCIASEGVFSMDGDALDLVAAAACKSDLQQQLDDALLWVDDAHGIGVTGVDGRGVVSLQPEPTLIDIISASFGKAFGLSGAFVAGSSLFIESLWQHARHYIYSTAFSAAQAEALQQALSIIITEPWHRQRLDDNIDYFKQGLLQQGWRSDEANQRLNHAIQPVHCGSNRRAVELSQKLALQGIACGAMRPPTVPAGHACLRFTLNACHSRNDIEQALDALGERPLDHDK